jgi:hypothetical protein
MSSVLVSTPYFYAESLKSRFTASLARAWRTGLISEEEYSQLKILLDSPQSEAFSGSGLRVDRLVSEDGVLTCDELGDALVISSAESGTSVVYLDTLLYGLERFSDRTALLNALEHYPPPDLNPAFECELIEGDLFEQRTGMIIDQQVARLRDLAAHLQRIPSLQSALTQALREHVDTLLPDVAIDLSLPRVQLFATDRGSSTLSACNQTLVEAATDVLTSQPERFSRRLYLRSNGQVVDGTHDKRYDKLLSDAANSLASVYERLLSDYWQHPNLRGQTRRTLAAHGLAEGFRQALLKGLHEGSLLAEEFTHLSRLLNPVANRDERSVVGKRLALVIKDLSPLKLVGLILLVGSPLPDLILYCGLHGIRRFTTFKALADHYATVAGRSELQWYMSLNDRALPSTDGELKIEAYEIEQPLFTDAVEAIIGLQKRNLGFVLAGPFSDADSAAAQIDDALDVRHLIDVRLASFDTGGRWLQAPVAFAQQWPPAKVLAPTAPPEPELTWIARIDELEKTLQWLYGAHIDMGECAEQMLNEYLAMFVEPSLTAKSIGVLWPDGPGDNDENHEVVSGAQASSPSSRPLALVDLLLNKLSGYRAQPIPQSAVVVSIASGRAQPEGLPMLGVDFINLMLERVSTRFVEVFLRQLQQRYSGPLRSAHRQIVPVNIAKRFLEDVLRQECELSHRVYKAERPSLKMLEQVLNYPVRSMRMPQGEERVEVYSVYLEHASGQAPALLSNCFILHRPLHSHKHVLYWSALSGIEVLKSFDSLKDRLNRRLAAGSSREHWLGLLGEPDRDRIRTYLEQPDQAPLGLQFNRIDNDFVGALLHIEYQRRHNNVEQALSRAVLGSMSAQVLQRFTRVAVDDERMSRALSTVSAAAHGQILQSMLPPWLSEASLEDLSTYVRLLKRHYLSDDPEKSLLPGLPSLQAFARAHLIKHLNADYPDQLPDPDRIMVTFTQYVPAPVPSGEIPSAVPAATVVNRETLTEFALNHFSNVAGAVLVVKLPDDLPVPQFISPGYFKSLVRTLDVGQQYRNLLVAKTAPSSPDYRLGRSRFMAKIPARMLLLAFEMKLQKQLSADAWGYLQSLLDMPDSLARQPIRGQQATLRPMLLLAASGLQPDPVPGVYLIGPKDESKGPIIVHAMFNEAFTFKEYPSKAQLLLDLQTPGDLQTLVLGRVDPVLRKRYDHGGFREPHIPWSTEGYMDGPTETPGPVLMVGEPVSGNVLQFLFDQTLRVLEDICHKQTVTTAEDDWKSLVRLMSLGAEQVLSFLPGQIGLLLAAWQSHTLFEASAVSAYARRWGKALSEFTAALGMLVVSRRSIESELAIHTRPAQEQPVVELGQQDYSWSSFSWRNPPLTPQLRSRLRALEVDAVALSDLEHNGLYNLYRDPQTLKQYASVVGRVYEVRGDNGHWQIVGPNGQPGPKIALDAEQRWQLDLRLGLAGGGGQVTRLQESRNSVDGILIVEAQGMSEIRRVYHERGSMIVEANIQARRYLENCLFNLIPSRRGGLVQGRAHHLLREFFGLTWLNPVLQSMVRKKATKLYLAITDPSLASLSSRRYVVGTNRPGNETTAAFISKSDPEKRIYLTELFFEVPQFTLNDDALRVGFNAAAHHRAGTLIHELAHLTGDTHDIADLDSSAPFADFLDDSNAENKAIRDELKSLRATALSHDTPADRLFRKYDRSNWRDFSDSDGAMKETILRITETSNLADARQVFLTNAQKRAEVILSNADSVAALLMDLGRSRVLPDTGVDEPISSSS